MDKAEYLLIHFLASGNFQYKDEEVLSFAFSTSSRIMRSKAVTLYLPDSKEIVLGLDSYRITTTLKPLFTSANVSDMLKRADQVFERPCVHSTVSLDATTGDIIKGSKPSSKIILSVGSGHRFEFKSHAPEGTRKSVKRCLADASSSYGWVKMEWIQLYHIISGIPLLEEFKEAGSLHKLNLYDFLQFLETKSFKLTDKSKGIYELSIAPDFATETVKIKSIRLHREKGRILLMVYLNNDTIVSKYIANIEMIGTVIFIRVLENITKQWQSGTERILEVILNTPLSKARWAS